MVSTGPIQLYRYEAGPKDGPLLILLHGFPESGRAWRRLMRPLAECGFHVVAPDLRGYGASATPERLESYALDVLVEDVVALADALGVDRFTLTGHDWGGIIAWAVAARHPGRLQRLIILNAPHPDTMADEMRGHPFQLLRSVYVAFFQIPRLPEALLGAFGYRLMRRALLASSRPGTFSATDLDSYMAEWSRPKRLTAMLNYYRALRLPRAPLGRIAVPTLILWGMKDSFLGSHLADAAASLCDEVRVVGFADSTHWLAHEEPRRVVTEIARP